MQAYSNPKRASDPYSLPDVEVFEVTGQQEYERYARNEDDILEAGWYWRSCFPGCLPDSDPFGPFETRDLALTDAQDGIDD